MSHKIKIQVKRKNMSPYTMNEGTPPGLLRPITIAGGITKEMLLHPENIDIYQLFKYCQQSKVPIRGDCHALSTALLKRHYNIHPKLCTPQEIIYKTWVKYYLWKIGNGNLCAGCWNDVDFYSSARIPMVYVFCVADATGSRTTMFDIRSLNEYVETCGSYKDPYTGEPFVDTIKPLMERKNFWLTRFGFQTKYVSVEYIETPAEKVARDTVNLFSDITQHHYVDYTWFQNLGFMSLQRLYFELHEIWSYRLPLTSSYKEELSPNGSLFTNWNNIQHYIRSTDEIKLRLELLRNIRQLVSTGITEDHHKTGCHIFMLGFVLVCQDAADSYPQLFQASYIGDDSD